MAQKARREAEAKAKEEAERLRVAEEEERKKRAGTEMKRRGPRMAPGKVRREGLRCLPPVSILVLFFLF